MSLALPKEADRRNVALLKVGLTVEQVRAQWVPKKGSCGRRGLPRHVVNAMHQDYQRLGSIAKVANLYGRSPQATWELFRQHQLPMNPGSKARRRPGIVFQGQLYTPSKCGFHGTTGRRRLLHHVIWESKHGPIPPGWQVSFLNGKFSDVRLENLFCATRAEVTRHHFRRLHPELAKLSPTERHQRRKQISLAFYYRRRANFWKAGLRCDGKPLRQVAAVKPAKPTISRVRPGTVESMWREFRNAA